MNRLRRMVKSHADMFVPTWNELIFAMARSKVSCTRSSARSTLPLSDIANARKLGTAASMAPSQIHGASSRQRCGHDGQRKRVAHMPAATTTKEESRSKLVQNHPQRLHEEAKF